MKEEKKKTREKRQISGGKEEHTNDKLTGNGKEIQENRRAEFLGLFLMAYQPAWVT